jgi:hypothetical protein
VSTPSEESREYFVTVIHGNQKGFLLGPYANHEEAKGNVERARDLAYKADPWSHFYAFGTASAPVGLVAKTVFGK